MDEHQQSVSLNHKGSTKSVQPDVRRVNAAELYHMNEEDLRGGEETVIASNSLLLKDDDDEMLEDREYDVFGNLTDEYQY